MRPTGMHTSTAAVLALLLTLGVTACDGGGAGAASASSSSGRPSDAVPAGSAAAVESSSDEPSPDAPPVDEPPLDVQEVGGHRVVPRGVVGVQVSGNWVSWTRIAADGEGTGDTVTVLNWRTGARRTVRSTFAPGRIEGADLVGHYLVLADQARPAYDADTVTTWRVLAVEVRTGRTTRLAGSRTPSPAPFPRAADGRVLWQELEDPDDPAAGVRVRTWTPGARVQDMRRHVRDVYEVLPSRGGAVLVRYADRRVRGLPAGDVRRWGATRGHGRSLSTDGLGMRVSAAGGVVAWTERADEGRQNADPVSLWTRWRGTTRRIVADGYPSEVVVGAGFLAWSGASGRLRLARPDGSARVALGGPRTSVPAGADADRHLLAYVTGTRLHVLEVD
ncbi:hypothetical protein H5V45_21220 [Nocardioides sp. KIGAM211]|uniref:Uncharacterized protein n=1 Tax=Nocardioides luti TaxID=2761101 RepID=A0A7X0RK68_9ACTN|nr:hypothetical protein [Nocardioides luti]MBB6629853.1 hypothetical protein [Nocardioides luti]